MALKMKMGDEESRAQSCEADQPGQCRAESFAGRDRRGFAVAPMMSVNPVQTGTQIRPRADEPGLRLLHYRQQRRRQGQDQP